jgi:integrase
VCVVVIQLFKRAVNEQRIKTNPWHGVQMPDDAIESSETQHYTLEETENIVSALVDHVDCQLVMALSCLLGLRPGEIAALRWEDFDPESVNIRRSVVRGNVGTPVDLHNLIARVIKPHVEGKSECERCHKVPKNSGVEWKTLYAGRRGACTAVIEATGGNYAVAQALLRHKSMKTTLDVYKKQITPQSFKEGMKLLEEAATKR